MEIDEHDVLAWIDDVRDYSKSIEMIWPEDAPLDVEQAIMDAIEALDNLTLKMQKYVD